MIRRERPCHRAVTSPLILSSVRLPEPCEEYATNQKHKKYDLSFEETQYEFCAMVFETLGAINEEGQDVLRCLFRYAAKRLGLEFSSVLGPACLAPCSAWLPSRF